MSRRYPNGFKEWMMAVVPGKHADEVARLVRDVWGIEMTKDNVKSFKSNHKIPSGTHNCNQRVKWTIEREQYLRENSLGKTSDVMAKEMSEVFGEEFTMHQIHSARNRFGVRCGVSTRFNEETSEKYKQYRFKKGEHVNKNTEYAKGHIPWNYCEVGSERLKGDAVYVKLQDGIGMKGWKRKHHIVLEEEYGPLPDDCKVIHLDGDPWNCNIENLRIANLAIMQKMRFRKIESKDPMLREANYLLSKLEREAEI